MQLLGIGHRGRHRRTQISRKGNYAARQLTFEKVRELDGQDDRFFESLLGAFKSGNVLPLDVRLLDDNSLVNRLLQLLRLLVPRIRIAVVGVLVVALLLHGFLPVLLLL